MLLTDLHQVATLSSMLRDYPFVFDLETKGLDPYKGSYIIGLGFYLPMSKQSYYISTNHLMINPDWQDLNDSLILLDSFRKEYRNAGPTKPERARLDTTFDELKERRDQLVKFVRHTSNLNLDEVLRLFKPTFENSDNEMSGFNIKFDAHFIRARKDIIDFKIRTKDVMMLAHLFNENELELELKPLGAKYCGADQRREQEEVLEAGKKLGFRTHKQCMANLDHIPLDIVAKYGEQDCVLTDKLYQYYVTQLLSEPYGEKLLKLYDELCDMNMILQEFEEYGMPVDLERAIVAQQNCQERIERLKYDMIYDYDLPEDFNPKSPDQIMRLFYDVEKIDYHKAYAKSHRQELKGTKYMATLFPTNKYDLDEIDSLIADNIIEFRKWDKAKSTYFNAFLELLDDNGRVHPNIRQAGTVAGRPSCFRPNALAIPRDDKIYGVKNVVVAKEGKTLLEIDYSMVELRVAGWYAQDKVMMAAFRKGWDLHKLTASMALNKPIEEVTKEDRQLAKAINFGFIYGMSAKKFKLYARRNYGVKDMTDEKAVAFRNKYFKMYSEIQPFSRRIFEFAQRNGYIELWTGRRRRFERKEKLHTAFNNLVQGGAAEIMRHSIMRLHERFKEDPTAPKMFLTVYDSLLMEVDEDKALEWYPEIKRIMEDWKFSVPIKVEGKIGRVWGQMEEIE